MSDPTRDPKKPEDPDIDELPSEAAPPAPGKGLSLEEEIATMTDLEIEDEPGGKKP